MSRSDGDLAELLNNLVIPGPNGRPGLTFGWLITVYFERSWTRPIREAVAELAEEHIRLVGNKLVCAVHPKRSRMYYIRENQVPMPSEWLPQHPDGDSWYFGFHGGEEDDDASAFVVAGMGSSGKEKDLGYYHVRLPITWFADNHGSLPEVALRICNGLRPVFGYGGIGFLLSMTFEGRRDTEPLVTPLAARFPGIEIDDPADHSWQMRDGIKGVNWLTMLGDRWVERAGGRDYLRIRLDEPTFPFYPYDGGLMIQSGPKPEIGDTTRDRWPMHYVTLHRVLKRIQITNHLAFHRTSLPGARMDKAASEAWLFRFDGK